MRTSKHKTSSCSCSFPCPFLCPVSISVSVSMSVSVSVFFCVVSRAVHVHACVRVHFAIAIAINFLCLLFVTSDPQSSTWVDRNACCWKRMKSHRFYGILLRRVPTCGVYLLIDVGGYLVRSFFSCANYMLVGVFACAHNACAIVNGFISFFFFVLYV